MHLLAYVFGFCYYVAATLSISAAWLDEALGQAMAEQSVDSVAASPCCRQVLGMVVFALGSVHQNRCHRILAQLRSGEACDTRHSREVGSYKLPRGDWFELVTAPHYFAEVLIYAALWLLQGSLAGASMPLMLVFVAANLSFTAYHSHRWYLQKFEDYPKSRRIIVPFLL
mmetsp:Transcript_3096/g.6222  ORF Transcript_3096/g.6222 Transcript_3096/m.6222 type:complete len:170 (-) Transcript_3096:123-632(-)